MAFTGINFTIFALFYIAGIYHHTVCLHTFQWCQHHLHEILYLCGDGSGCNPRDPITWHSWITIAIFNCNISIIGQSVSVKHAVFLDLLIVFCESPVVQWKWEWKFVSTVHLSVIWFDFNIQLAIARPWLLSSIKFQWSQARSLSIILWTSQPQNRTTPSEVNILSGGSMSGFSKKRKKKKKPVLVMTNNWKQWNGLTEIFVGC